MQYSAFIDEQLFTAGELKAVVAKIKQAFPYREALLVETNSCKRLDINWQGSLEDVLARLDGIGQSDIQPTMSEALKSSESKPSASEQQAKPKRGRPKLGVVSKEVTLLPRHWEWLSQQSGGASVTLRRLIDQARQENSIEDDIKLRQGQLYNFISFFAEKLPNVEEAIRALYRQDTQLFRQSTQHWPIDIKHFCEEKFIAIPVLG